MDIVFKNKKFNINPYECYNNEKFPLFIYITNICNARCEYCASSCNKYNGDIDFKELKEFLDEYSDKILRVSISGGEPLINIKSLKKLLKLLKKYHLNISLHTNGYFLLKNIRLLNRFKINPIMISRHHYDDNLNNEIFKIKTLSLGDLKKLKSKNKIEISCLLIKNYIDSMDKVVEFLEQVSDSEVESVGFVSMLQVNDYTKKNFVDYRDLIENISDRFKEINKMNDGNRCSCSTYLYMAKNNKIILVYFKYTKNSNLSGRSLLFDYNGLQAGYYSKKIDD